jgi:hypothetical protein
MGFKYCTLNCPFIVAQFTLTSQQVLTTNQIRAAEKIVVFVVKEGHKPRIFANFYSRSAVDQSVGCFWHSARIDSYRSADKRNQKQKNHAREVHRDVYSQMICKQLTTKSIRAHELKFTWPNKQVSSIDACPTNDSVIYREEF